jgi:hypothetical protein
MIFINYHLLLLLVSLDESNLLNSDNDDITVINEWLHKLENRVEKMQNAMKKMSDVSVTKDTLYLTEG